MNQQKFSKDQIQKICLSVIGFFALLYVYFNFFLAPLTKSRTGMQHQIEELRAKIDASQTEIPKAANLEHQAASATQRYAALQALTPEGAPIAWFPPRMKVFFANQQIEKSSVKLDSSSVFAQKELADWTHYLWQLDLPQTDFATAGKAIAQLENTEPLMSVRRISMRASTENPEFQQVSLTADSAILKR